ncbi:MAG: hypothetical protein KDE14_06905 [Rhodobacteraceae bacterium]|nr:hypothetical protein [Paracoccaceae bacterium]
MSEKGIIKINKLLPNSIMTLEPQRSFIDYYRVYGDRLAMHYENNGVILLPFAPIDLDLEIFQILQLPDAWKKPGGEANASPLFKPLYQRTGDKFSVDTTHPLLFVAGGDVAFAQYLQSQMTSVNAQFMAGLQHLFPLYRLPPNPTITWRFTVSENEIGHLDEFARNRPYTPELRKRQRMKAFFNVDTKPRAWRISYDIPTFLKVMKDKLPQRLPPDTNILSEVINRTGLLTECPWHEVSYPQMSLIIANGESVAHQVLFGRRVIGYEANFLAEDMIEPEKAARSAVAKWITDAGLEVDDDPNPRGDKYVATGSMYQTS